ncbi:MAG: hypothetical protein DMF58_18480 [Acidobacteria bacterium]|nr:MAG: hypothetical protein DMF58_18480 [Acidobacteriota bacterium]
MERGYTTATEKSLGYRIAAIPLVAGCTAVNGCTPARDRSAESIASASGRSAASIAPASGRSAASAAFALALASDPSAAPARSASDCCRDIAPLNRCDAALFAPPANRYASRRDDDNPRKRTFPTAAERLSCR